MPMSFQHDWAFRWCVSENWKPIQRPQQRPLDKLHDDIDFSLVLIISKRIQTHQNNKHISLSLSSQSFIFLFKFSDRSFVAFCQNFRLFCFFSLMVLTKISICCYITSWLWICVFLSSFCLTRFFLLPSTNFWNLIWVILHFLASLHPHTYILLDIVVLQVPKVTLFICSKRFTSKTISFCFIRCKFVVFDDPRNEHAFIDIVFDFKIYVKEKYDLR